MATPAPKQYYFVSNRDINVGTVHGYSIEFKKGVPTHVPKKIHSIVMEKGIMPCDANGKTLDTDAVEVPEATAKIVLAPEEAEDRAEEINKVIDALVKRNSSKDFSAGGVPSASAVTAALGWKVDAKEIRPLWDKYKAAKAQE